MKNTVFLVGEIKLILWSIFVWNKVENDSEGINQS